MTAATAVTGFGRLPHFMNRPQPESNHGADDGFFSHTQTSANDAVRATANGSATAAFAGASSGCFGFRGEFKFHDAGRGGWD